MNFWNCIILYKINDVKRKNIQQITLICAVECYEENMSHKLTGQVLR